MYQTKDTLLRPDWKVIGFVVAMGALFIGVALAQDSTQQQEVVDLEQRITAYQTGNDPAGPTRAELTTQIAKMETELASVKEQLAACEKAAE